MKIGILTLPISSNYGGILQAYALQNVLVSMGHNVCLIEKKREKIQKTLWKVPLSKLKQEVLMHSINRFIKNKIGRETVNDFSDVSQFNLDAIIVGSDQIWRPIYFNDNIENAFLEFAMGWNIKRIAYAASFGTDEWEYTPEQTKHCKALLKYFNNVSVRESSGVELCQNKFGINAQIVLDPTMLLLKRDYINLFESVNTPKSRGSLLCYILDETFEKMDLIKRIANEKKLVPFRVNAKKGNTLLSEHIYPSIEKWLRGFYDAKFVVTDSFHACVFSIIFNKPFIAIGNVNRGMSRFNSLLSMFGLDNRLIITPSEYEEKSSINWNNVNSILDVRRAYSLNFLTESLSN